MIEIIFFIAAAILIIAPVLHEFGHYLILKRYNPEAKIIYKEVKGKIIFGTYGGDNLSRSQELNVYLFGVWFGFVPIFIAFIYLTPFIILALPYFYACRNDIKSIIKLYKGDRIGN